MSYLPRNGEIKAFQKKGLNIIPHRKRLVNESPGLDEKFKDSNHPLRLIFVCAMWMTGFDVPSCATIYLDKPMRNHTLMQTIARANRVFGNKINGSSNVELFFSDLIQFARTLETEDKRAIAQNLSEEELAIFDLLTKPNLTLTQPEEKAVKQVAKELLKTLKKEKLVLDWQKRQQTKASVEVAIKEILDQLPESYSATMYQQKCDEVYQHIYESYSGQGRSIYGNW